MRTIEVYADVCCPFTHAGLRRLVAHRDAVGGGPRLVVRAWPLELVNGVPLAADLVAHEAAELRDQVSPDLFAGLDVDRFPATSLPALALTAVAYRTSVEVGEAVALALRWALFEEGRDVAEAEVLAAIAGAHGVALPDEAAHEQVVDDWEQGRARGVIGSPHFFVGAEGFFCPGLDIRKEGEHFAIRPDVTAFAEFVDRAFAAEAG
ncbi:MAG: DsbA family protein [Acidimicrobiales bacterium]